MNRINTTLEEYLCCKPTEIAAIPFMSSFWDYPKSLWVKEEKVLGFEPTKRYCDNQRYLILQYFQSYFGNSIKVSDISTDVLQQFLFDMRLKNKLAGSTINQLINACRKPFHYLYQKNVITDDPTEKLRRFKESAKKREIPSEEEILLLTRSYWKNDVGRLSFYLAAFCGMRAGEISALRISDIDTERNLLCIQHSWNTIDGLKLTKNKERRCIPCNQQMLLNLKALAKLNPMKDSEDYVFWSPQRPAIPYTPSALRKMFYRQLESIGISEDERKKRNLVFHSLRHFCATVLCQQTSLRIAQEILGHKTTEMTQHYSNHDNQKKYAEMRIALEKCTDYILQFDTENVR